MLTNYYSLNADFNREITRVCTVNESHSHYCMLMIFPWLQSKCVGKEKIRRVTGAMRKEYTAFKRNNSKN